MTAHEVRWPDPGRLGMDGRRVTAQADCIAQQRGVMAQTSHLKEAPGSCDLSDVVPPHGVWAAKGEVIIRGHVPDAPAVAGMRHGNERRARGVGLGRLDVEESGHCEEVLVEERGGVANAQTLVHLQVDRSGASKTLP